MCTFLFFEVLLFIWFAGIGTWFASDGGEASELLGSPVTQFELRNTKSCVLQKREKKTFLFHVFVLMFVPFDAEFESTFGLLQVQTLNRRVFQEDLDKYLNIKILNFHDCMTS